MPALTSETLDEIPGWLIQIGDADAPRSGLCSGLCWRLRMRLCFILAGMVLGYIVLSMASFSGSVWSYVHTQSVELDEKLYARGSSAATPPGGVVGLEDLKHFGVPGPRGNTPKRLDNIIQAAKQKDCARIWWRQKLGFSFASGVRTEEWACVPQNAGPQFSLGGLAPQLLENERVNRPLAEYGSGALFVAPLLSSLDGSRHQQLFSEPEFDTSGEVLNGAAEDVVHQVAKSGASAYTGTGVAVVTAGIGVLYALSAFWCGSCRGAFICTGRVLKPIDCCGLRHCRSNGVLCFSCGNAWMTGCCSFATSIVLFVTSAAYFFSISSVISIDNPSTLGDVAGYPWALKRPVGALVIEPGPGVSNAFSASGIAFLVGFFVLLLFCCCKKGCCGIACFRAGDLEDEYARMVMKTHKANAARPIAEESRGLTTLSPVRGEYGTAHEAKYAK